MSADTDLIDTLWNVKEDGRGSQDGSFGFNRYIVECKVGRSLISESETADLIDTLWNVKRFFFA